MSNSNSHCTDDSGTGSKILRGLSRRDLLKLGGTTAFIMAGGFTAVSTASNHLPGSTTVNLGNQGLDPGDDIQPMVDNHLADDTNVIIPGDDDNPIQYAFNDDIRGTYSDAALVGDGMVELVRSDGVTRSISIEASGGDFVLGNITSIGRQGPDNEKWRAHATNGGSMTVQNVHQPDGAEGSEQDGIDVASGWYVPNEHSDDLTFYDCSVQGFPDNGFYASAPNNPYYIDQGTAGLGPVYFRGCVAQNNNVSGIRVGTDNSEVTDCVIINDAQAPPTEGDTVMRGFRIRNGGDNIYVENLDVDYSYGGSGTGPAFDVEDTAAGGSCTAQDVTIRNDASDQAVLVETSNYSLSGDDLDLTGSGDLGYDGSWTNVCVGSGCDSPSTTPPETDCGPLDGGGGSPDPDEVDEDFSHDDVPGTYSLDTGSFTTSSTRSTSDTYSLRADSGTDSNQFIIREDMGTSAGNSYTLDVYFPSGGDNDLGFAFAAQDGVTGWSDYTGYFAILVPATTRSDSAARTAAARRPRTPLRPRSPPASG